MTVFNTCQGTLNVQYQLSMPLNETFGFLLTLGERHVQYQLSMPLNETCGFLLTLGERHAR